MNKSKYFDMAGDIAASKLMPRPEVQVTISMQRGGGLNEKPISSAYGRPIPRFVYRDKGGGLIQLAEGSTRWNPYAKEYNVEEMSDKKLADKLAIEDILRSGIPDEDLSKSGLIRIRTRPWALDQGEEFEKRKGGDKEAHIRKLYYLSLKRLLDKVKQNADKTETSPSYERMERLVDKGMTETFPEEYAEPIAPEYMGEYKMRLEPGDTQDFKDAYLGGGYPGPSFVPNKEQTAPVFESSSVEEIEDKVQSAPPKEFSSEKIISDLYGPETQAKNKGGGLSNLKKSIKINGQPHSLAWIRPDEASALKAMGGSGKKVEGIPAYFDDYSWGAEVSEGDPDVGASWSSDLGDPYTYGASTDPTQDPGARGGQSFADENVYDTTTPADTTTSRTVGDDYGAFGETKEDWKDYDFPDEAWLDEKSNIKGGFLGLFGDYITNREALRGARKVGYDNWRATVGQYSRDPGKDYDKWFAGQDKDALLEGYAIGDPFGKAMEFKMREVNEQLQDKFKKEKEKLKDDDSELSKEELQEAVKGIEGLKGFTPYSGIDYPVWAPGGMAVGLMNLLSSTVIGTGTVNGIGVHVHKDGSVTAISPEDSPGFTSGEDTGNVVEDRRRRRPVREVASVSETVEEDVAPAKGTMKELVSRRGPAATRAEGLASLKKGVLAKAYPGRDFNIG